MEGRTLRFRVWDKTNQRMWTNPNIPNVEFVIDSYGGVFDFNSDTGYKLRRRDDCIAQQLTGMKDKNGKEIYEGDVVIGITDPDYVDQLDPDAPAGSYKGTIRFDNGSFQIKTDGLDVINLGSHILATLEVLGNIYEQEQPDVKS